MEDFLRVGVITSTHGLKGEVKVFPTTDDNNRFKSLKKCYIVTKNGNVEVECESVKFFKNMVILKFKEFNDINEIEKFRQCDLVVTREDAVPLLEGEFYICDIIGAKAYDQNGNLIGHVDEFMDSAANGIFVIKNENDEETLIPVVKEWVDSIDTEKKEVKVHLWGV